MNAADLLCMSACYALCVALAVLLFGGPLWPIFAALVYAAVAILFGEVLLTGERS